MANLYPPDCVRLIEDYRPVSAAWAAAAGVTEDDVRQEIAAAWLAGSDPGAAVPRALGVRRLAGGWRSADLAVGAAELGDVDVAEIGEKEAGEDASGLAAALVGGTEAVAKRCCVGRRAAQLRVKAQLERFEMGGDLFLVNGEH